jgi:hypothetical protein
VLKTIRFKSLRTFAATLIATAVVVAPLPLSNNVASAAAISATSGVYAIGRIEIGMGAVIDATKPPALSSFDVQVTYDGLTTRNLVTQFEVSSLTNIQLFLTSTVFIGATVTISYTAPDIVNDLSNNALQKATSGIDYFSFTNLPVTNASGVYRSQPNTPAAPTVIAGEEDVTITVTRPTGGLTPTSYVVTSSPDNKTCTVTGASGSCTITGLTAGTSYTFTTVAQRSGFDSPASASSPAVTVLTKTAAPVTNGAGDTTAPPATSGTTASWDVEPATDSETDAFTEGFWPAAIPGSIIITNEFGFAVDKKNGIKPKIRMKNYAGKIKMTISASYKDGAKAKKYKCSYAAFGSTKKAKTAKWKWYTPKKACILPKPLVTALKAGTTKLSATGKWTRLWATTGTKSRADKTKVKPRTLKYTVRAKPAVAK